LKILAIGNSFSSDATRYLHEISIAGKIPIKVVNLFIGGCSLETHYINMMNDNKDYLLDFNGKSTGFYVSIKEALKSDEWDFVTMQQASHFSPDYNTYMPFLKHLSEYVKYHAPQAEQVFHRTWAYENGSERLCVELGYKAHSDMFKNIKAASEKAVNEVGIKRIIPSGDLIEKMVLEGIQNIYLDTYHLSLGLGRFAIASLWYKFFTGQNIKDNDFVKFDEGINDSVLKKIKNIVDETISYDMSCEGWK